MFVNEIIFDVDMFSMRVVDRIISKSNTSLIVSMNDSSNNLGIVEFINKIQSHMAFFMVLKDVIYSASTKEVATVSCFFDNYRTELLVTLNRKPLIEHLLSGSYA